eukprot:8397645-Alexandrium_andersonii.AAC.1
MRQRMPSQTRWALAPTGGVPTPGADETTGGWARGGGGAGAASSGGGPGGGGGIGLSDIPAVDAIGGAGAATDGCWCCCCCCCLEAALAAVISLCAIRNSRFRRCARRSGPSGLPQLALHVPLL